MVTSPSWYVFLAGSDAACHLGFGGLVRRDYLALVGLGVHSDVLRLTAMALLTCASSFVNVSGFRVWRLTAMALLTFAASVTSTSSSSSTLPLLFRDLRKRRGLGSRVWGLGFGVSGPVAVQGPAQRRGLGFRVWGLGFGVSGPVAVQGPAQT